MTKWIIIALIFVAGLIYLARQEIREISAPPPEPVAAPSASQTAPKIEEEKIIDSLPARVPKSPGIKLSPETRQTLYGLAKEPDDKVRWAAIELLYRVDDEKALLIIRDCLAGEPEMWVRKNVVDMLGQTKDKQSLYLLDKALGDYEKDVKLAAVEALGNFESSEALPALTRAMQDFEPEVKLKAVEAVNRIESAIKRRKEEKLRSLQSKEDSELLPWNSKSRK